MKTVHMWRYKHVTGVTVFDTFQVQILGPVDTLTRGCSIYFQCVGVAVVSGDGHIVPLVVVQRPVTFALDEVWPISEVKDIVDVSAREKNC